MLAGALSACSSGEEPATAESSAAAAASATSEPASESPSTDTGEDVGATATQPKAVAPLHQDRDGLPADFPKDVPTPEGASRTVSDTIGRDSTRSWRASFTGFRIDTAKRCDQYAQALEAAGYYAVAGSSDVGLAMRGLRNDVTMVCGTTYIDLIVNPRLV